MIKLISKKINELIDLATKSNIGFYTLILVISLLIVIIISPPISLNPPDLQVGSIASNDIVVEADTEIIDRYTSNLLRKKTIEDKGLYFNRNRNSSTNDLNLLHDSFSQFYESQKNINNLRYRFNKSHHLKLFGIISANIEYQTILNDLPLKDSVQEVANDSPSLNDRLKLPYFAENFSKKIEQLKNYLDINQTFGAEFDQNLKETTQYINKIEEQNIAKLLFNLNIKDLDPKDIPLKNTLASQDFENLIANLIAKIHQTPFLEDKTLLKKESSTKVNLIYGENEILNIGSLAEIPDKYAKIEEIIRNYDLNFSANITQKFLEGILTPSLTYDEEFTQKELDKINQTIRTVKVWLKKGQILVRKGEKLTAEKTSLIASYQEANKTLISFPKFGGTFVIVLLVLSGLAVIIIFRSKKKDFIKYKKTWVMLSFFLLLLQVVIYKLIINIVTPIFSALPELWQTAQIYVFPTGLSAILLATLIRPKLSTPIAIVSSIFSGLLFPTNPVNFIFPLISNLLTVALLHRSKIITRTNILSLGAKIALTNALLIIALNSINNPLSFENINYYNIIGTALLGVIGGFLSAFFAIVLLPFLEYLFDIKTDIKLLEWSTVSHPLLRELLEKAPGSYQHSLAVGSLSEAGAIKIGANAIFCRIASYYHDIGKMYNPSFFIENMRDQSKNPHVLLSDPVKSKDIITGHVLKGVDLAKKHKLGRQITDIIKEHHGTTLLRYFYMQACKKLDQGLLDKELVNVQKFSYPGPKPQTPESALIMLADICEATVRSLSNISSKKIKDAVKIVSTHILEEGQLDDSKISLRDFKEVQNTYIELLIAQNHMRITYPDLGTENSSKIVYFPKKLQSI